MMPCTPCAQLDVCATRLTLTHFNFPQTLRIAHLISMSLRRSSLYLAKRGKAPS